MKLRIAAMIGAISPHFPRNLTHQRRYRVESHSIALIAELML